MIKYKNKGKCKQCGDILESKHRHDFVTCSCGSLSLDGGLAYQRILWRGGELDDIMENITEPVDAVDVKTTAAISAIEREREQEYYARLVEVLETEKETSTK